MHVAGCTRIKKGNMNTMKLTDPPMTQILVLSNSDLTDKIENFMKRLQLITKGNIKA